MVKTISDPTAGCCESATDGPLQKRRFVHFVVFIVLSAICVGLLAAFGTHVDSIESKRDRDKWNRWLPAIYGPMCIFLLLAAVFCFLTFCCGGKIQVPESPGTHSSSTRLDSKDIKNSSLPPASAPARPAPPAHHVYQPDYHPDDPPPPYPLYDSYQSVDRSIDLPQGYRVQQPADQTPPRTVPPPPLYHPADVNIVPHNQPVQPPPWFAAPYQSQQHAVFSPRSARRAHDSADV